MNVHVQRLHHVVIRFAGDSGDGMQLAGGRFTTETATFGNDLATFPSFPAEIRAPAGSLAGVSSFQLQFADHAVLTAGDAPDVLVAMNPAALRVNVSDLRAGGVVIVNSDAFTKRNLARAGYAVSPLDDGSLSAYRVVATPLSTLTAEALAGSGLSKRDVSRATNMFALGLVSWLYQRPTVQTVEFLARRFESRPEVAAANVTALRAGWNFGETTESFESRYEVPPAEMAPGTYRNMTGNLALAWGLLVAAQRCGLPLFLGSYPITPASDILHELSSRRRFGVVTFQAEDEIAAVGAALGAAFGGALAVTATSGPGMTLKAETIGLAVAVELPLVVCDIQRAGPSTGMPTKTEQADLMQALWGRNGESPVPVLAPRSPADCFDIAMEAARIATVYRTPVIVLSDAYLAGGSEPWNIPDLDQLTDLAVDFAAPADDPFLPFARDPVTLARPWAVPGTPGLQYRVGGIEKADRTGEISYDGENHHRMVELRKSKIDGIASTIPPLVVDDPGDDAAVLVVGWGSTYGSITTAVQQVRESGGRVAQAHLRHLHPLPGNTDAVLARYDTVLVPEVNCGQLAMLLQARSQRDVLSYSRVRGEPLRTDELAMAIQEVLGGDRSMAGGAGR